MEKSILPPMTQQPILYIDMTPTDDLALRILRAYRENCDCRWSGDTDGSAIEDNPMLQMMNEHQDKRAGILDKAITVLEEAQE